MEKILVGERIRKVYGTKDEQRSVLDDISMEIAKGEFVAIMGPSGSGKSTLLYALSGMDRIDGGNVIFEKNNLSSLDDTELSDIRRASMGFVFQQPYLLRDLQLLDNILLPSVRRNKKIRKELLSRAKTLMNKTGIGMLEDRYLTQASGGQLQRAGLCRALINNPKILFADEPTGALDSASAVEIMHLLADVHKSGTTILLVTHDRSVAARAQRVLFLIDGKIAGELHQGSFDCEHDDLSIRIENLEQWTRTLQR